MRFSRWSGRPRSCSSGIASTCGPSTSRRSLARAHRREVLLGHAPGVVLPQPELAIGERVTVGQAGAGVVMEPGAALDGAGAAGGALRRRRRAARAACEARGAEGATARLQEQPE